MMTHDPFQNYQAFGAYAGLPFTGLQPFATQSPIGGQPQLAFQGAGLQGTGIPGQQGFGQPFQSPLQALNPLAALAQNPILQNPILQNPILQNPVVQNALLQNQILQNQILQNQALQNPLLQNPLLQHSLLQHSLVQNPWQNPYLAASLQYQVPNPTLGIHSWPQQQQQYPYPLAPQSLIGTGGIGQQFGQLHPLAQVALRQAYGYSPVAGCF